MTKVGNFICIQMVELKNLQEPLIWEDESCAIPFATNTQMRAEIVLMTTVKKLKHQSGCFENTPKFNWQPMEFFQNRVSC